MGFLSDLHVVATEIGPLRHDIKLERQDIAANRAEMAALRSELAAARSDIAALRADIAALRADIQRLIDIFKQPTQPGHFGFLVTSQTGVGNMLKFSVVNIPAVDTTDPNNSDVDHRTLTVTVAGGSAQTKTIAGTAAVDAVDSDDTGAIFQGNAGDTVSASLVSVDGSGNTSVSRDETATLVDTIAPAQPGDFGFQVTGQN